MSEAPYAAWRHCPPAERRFLVARLVCPTDTAARWAYADWLEAAGRPAEAAVHRADWRAAGTAAAVAAARSSCECDAVPSFVADALSAWLVGGGRAADPDGPDGPNVVLVCGLVAVFADPPDPRDARAGLYALRAWVTWRPGEAGRPPWPQARVWASEFLVWGEPRSDE